MLGSSICTCMRVLTLLFCFYLFVFISWCIVCNLPCSSGKQHDSNQNTAFVRAMYKKGAGNDKQGKDAGNRTLSPYGNFSQAIKVENSMTRIRR